MAASEGNLAMARQQKNIQLDTELVDVVEAHQLGMGTTFTRVVTASLLKYLFEDPAGPSPEWIYLAMQLEKDLEVWRAPILFNQYRRQMAESQIPHSRQNGEDTEETARLQEIVKQTADHETTWKFLLSRAGGGQEGMKRIAVHLRGPTPWSSDD